jgi:RNA 3'-terminal phosphate cyclase (ATP)
MIEIDGSDGEGGGQIIRSALALSIITAQPFRAVRVRAGRAKPGLRKQHLTALRAAATISSAEVTGDHEGSTEITFRPRGLHPGAWRFDIGSAGSTTLLFQALMPALLAADEPSSLTLVGGTHNPMAPPFDFLEAAFLPLVRAIGHDVRLELVRPGFYPAGGGELRATIVPAKETRPLVLKERGDIRAIRAVAQVARLPLSIAEREIAVLGEKLSLSPAQLCAEELDPRTGPGNCLHVRIESESVTEVFSGIGERGVRAETVAERAAKEARAYLAAGVPVGEHLADQLLLPLALARGGTYRTSEPTMHTHTQIRTMQKFIEAPIAIHEEKRGLHRIEVTPRSPVLA